MLLSILQNFAFNAEKKRKIMMNTFYDVYTLTHKMCTARLTEIAMKFDYNYDTMETIFTSDMLL